MTRLRDDLHDVAVLQPRPQRHHAAVDPRAHALVADIGVNAVREVDRRGAARKRPHFALRREDVDLFGIQVDLEVLQELLRVAHLLLDFEELLAHIGYGKLSARTVLQKSVPAELKEKAPESTVISVVKRVFQPGTGADKIKVRGTDDVMVFRAKCCNPIRGEKIVGYITRGKGVSVHSAGCPNVLNLMFDPERRIDVEWDQAAGDAPYIVRLTMQVEDRKGMLAEISAKVSDINTNITNMQARTGDDQQARIDMTVEIRDVKHLDKVIKSIKGVQGVLGVERTARV